MKPKTIVKSDKPMTLKEMQDAVGGSIELAYDDGEMQIVCNEEGKMLDLPENEQATDIWLDKLDEQGRGTLDYLAGDVLILRDKARMD
jgi:penicillin V acylase-like amidase (Ntn superfamily)